MQGVHKGTKALHMRLWLKRPSPVHFLDGFARVAVQSNPIQSNPVELNLLWDKERLISPAMVVCNSRPDEVAPLVTYLSCANFDPLQNPHICRANDAVKNNVLVRG